MSSDDDEWCPNFLCLFGLTPFAAWYAVTGSFVSFIVTINGVLFHLFFPRSSLVRRYDVACNACFALWVNLSVMNSLVALFTLVGGASHVLNATLVANDKTKDAVHVVAVQMPLWIVLCASGF
ncbi:MAG: hypothetical protein CMI16_06850 [Opitutaceae bacterium]|nr:hypothetical protein [Opitutaceae bacterium]